MRISIGRNHYVNFRVPKGYVKLSCKMAAQIPGNLKVEQERALNCLLAGKDVVAILPTGFGKSRINEAFAQTKNVENSGKVVVLVIAPLDSIIKDQIAHSELPAVELSSLKKQDFQTCPFKIVFSSAEDALSKKFTDELKNRHGELYRRLALIVVEETHTVETKKVKVYKNIKFDHDLTNRNKRLEIS
jgi:superfamily II DNA helicase RecQ